MDSQETSEQPPHPSLFSDVVPVPSPAAVLADESGAKPRAGDEQETVRPDRNLEKWPIWEPSNSRHPPKARVIQREIRLPDGNRVVAKVEVGFSDKGVLTTEDQKTLYALVRYWEERDRPTEAVVFSKQQLSRILRKSWGQKVNAALTASLLRLRFTPFMWERSYYDNATRETVGRIDTFTILSELQLVYRRSGNKTTREACTFRFNERILTNLLTGYTRPVFLDTVLSFKSELAQILYSHLDLVLSDKNHYERRTKELFDDLGIIGTTYRFPSKRAQILEPALRELEGQPLPTGALREVRLEKTVDGKDFKIVVRKARGRPAKLSGGARAEAVPVVTPPRVGEQPTTPPATTNKSGPAGGKREEVRFENEHSEKGMYTGDLGSGTDAQVRHFHQVFFRSGETAQPTAKELRQAQDHLSRLGEEKARYLVTFAFRTARSTNFDIQTYGGLLQYEGRAVAEFDDHARLRTEALSKKSQQGHQERFSGAYADYVREVLSRLEASHSTRFAAFRQSEDQFRERYAHGPLAGHSATLRVLRDYDLEETRLQRVAEFFAPGTEGVSEGEAVLGFWEWDTTFNPSPFSARKLS